MQKDAHPLTRTGTVLLESAFVAEGSRNGLLFSAPERVLLAHTLEEVPELLETIDRAVNEGAFAAGYLSYEAGYAFEAIGPLRLGALPLVWFGIYERPEILREEELDRLLAQDDSVSRVTDRSFQISRTDYREKIEAIKSFIREGDVYQINFTAPYTFRLDGSPLALYRELRRRQRVPYAAFVNLENSQILSLSPELFFQRDGDRIITRPMKGTIRRGHSPAEDEVLRQHLADDEKSRAENLMIVDLLRNDLSILCHPGSVRVAKLFTTELYETLIQMTSTIEGRLRERVGLMDLFQALFPCGSVTGAPKIRSMQLIQKLEMAPRGVYCGSIGYFAPGAKAVFNVAIRTAVIHRGMGTLGLGSGIVWNSDADEEYDECLLKARFFTGRQPEPVDFSLIETMLWDGAIELLDYHKARLGRSAQFLGFLFDEATFDSWVAQETAGLNPEDRYKVRVLLHASGQISITTERLENVSTGERRVIISPHHVDSCDTFLYHKTTRRRLYEEEYRRIADAGYYEAIFLNERGEITEGTRTNLFIRKSDRFFTPPVSCGLLSGVYRQYLLETRPDTSERVLYPEDLESADGLYVCNAVRGLEEVTLTPIKEEDRSGKKG